MKSKYTKAQRAAAELYRLEQDKLRALESQSEELLSEGSYVQRELILKEADRQRSHLSGMRQMAAAMGFEETALLAAARSVPGSRP